MPIDLIDKFYSHLREHCGIGKTTAQKFCRIARDFLAANAATPLGMLTDQHVLDYSNIQKEPRESLIAIKQLDSYLVKKSIRLTHFAQHLRKKSGPPVFNQKININNYNQFHRLFYTLNLEEQVLTGILISTAVRAKESSNLLVRDVLPPIGSVIKGKCEKSRNLALPPIFKNSVKLYVQENSLQLDDYLFSWGGSEHFYPALRRVFDGAMLKVGLPHYKPHDMRRLSISNIVTQGSAAFAVFYAGHEKKTMTARYSGIDFTMQKIMNSDTLFTYLLPTRKDGD